MLGAMFFARVLNLTGNTRSTVIYLIACAVIYVVWAVGRTLAKRKRERDE